MEDPAYLSVSHQVSKSYCKEIGERIHQAHQNANRKDILLRFAYLCHGKQFSEIQSQIYEGPFI